MPRSTIMSDPLNVKAEPKEEWDDDEQYLQDHHYGPVATRRRSSNLSSGAIEKRNAANTVRRARNDAKLSFRREVKEVLTSDSSENEIVHEDLAKHVGNNYNNNNENLYAFGASGENVLMAALSKAKDKYEDKLTRDLAKEYELVSPVEEESGLGYVADMDDFEVIHHDSM